MTHGESTAEQPAPGWRFRVGVLFFVLGLVSPVFVPLVAASALSAEWKATLSGLFLLGIPELFWLVAAAVLGKPGFNYLKGKVFGFFKKYAPPEAVSRTRYRVGLALFLFPLLFGWLAPYVSHLIPGYEEHRLALGIAGDLMLLTSLFVLGGEFWDKLRSLFIYGAKAQKSSAGP